MNIPLTEDDLIIIEKALHVAVDKTNCCKAYRLKIAKVADKVSSIVDSIESENIENEQFLTPAQMGWIGKDGRL